MVTGFTPASSSLANSSSVLHADLSSSKNQLKYQNELSRKAVYEIEGTYNVILYYL